MKIYNKSTDFCSWPTPKKDQLDWFADKDGKVIADFIGRFENLQKDLEFIL